MSQKPYNTKSAFNEEKWDEDEYSDMEILEMLESVREDMEELGVTTLQEVIARIEDLHKRLDSR